MKLFSYQHSLIFSEIQLRSNFNFQLQQISNALENNGIFRKPNDIISLADYLNP